MSSLLIFRAFRVGFSCFESVLTKAFLKLQHKRCHGLLKRQKQRAPESTQLQKLKPADAKYPRAANFWTLGIQTHAGGAKQ